MNRRELLVAAAAAPLGLAMPETAAAGRVGGVPVALVTADREAHVAVVSLNDGRVERRIPTLRGPRSIEAAFMTLAVVAHTASGRVSVLDAISLTVKHVVSGFGAPRYTTASETQQLAYVTDSARREVVTVDLLEGKILWRAPVPGPARHISASPDGTSLWTSLGSKAERVAVLDLGDPLRPRLVRTVAPPFLAHDVVFAPGGDHVWVTSGDRRRLAVYEQDGRRPAAVLAAGSPPQHVAFSGGRAFVASGDDGTVRLHRPDGEVVDESQVPVGSYNVTAAWSGAVTPSLGRGTLALLDNRGQVRSVQRVARAAHDACLVVTA